jgi:CubicO group peptidase (beta-lactamase class C family)
MESHVSTVAPPLCARPGENSRALLGKNSHWGISPTSWCRDDPTEGVGRGGVSRFDIAASVGSAVTCSGGYRVRKRVGWCECAVAASQEAGRDVRTAWKIKMQTVLVEDASRGKRGSFEEVRALLQEGVDEGVFPGAVLIVGTRRETGSTSSGKGVPGNVADEGSTEGSILFRGAVGWKSARGAKGSDAVSMDEQTVFDVAGVTSGVVTTTIFMKLVELGRVSLDERVSRYLPGFGVLGKSPITIGHLLAHTAGLPPWHPYYEDLLKENLASRSGILTSRGARDFILNSILRSQFRGEINQRYQYSEVGLTVLGAVIEVATGLSLDKAAFRYVFQPFGLKSTSYIDLSRIKRRGLLPVTEMIAPTEECSWRKRLLWGEVHDDNAWAMGGIAAHSGLFSTAEDLHRVAVALLSASKGTGTYLSRETIDLFLKGTETSSGQVYKYGWDSPSRENGLDETGLSALAFGYNGFTGCSLWIDPVTGTDIVLMTNRVHPSRTNKKIQAYRPELFRAILTAVPRISA